MQWKSRTRTRYKRVTSAQPESKLTNETRRREAREEEEEDTRRPSIISPRSEEGLQPHNSLQDLFFFLPPPPPPLAAPMPPAEPRSSLPAFTAILTASSNTSSTPTISLLLHSTYVAPIRDATAAPCSGVTGVRPCVLSRSIQARFVRRSDFRPTRIKGVVGQKWRTSGYH